MQVIRPKRLLPRGGCNSACRNSSSSSSTKPPSTHSSSADGGGARALWLKRLHSPPRAPEPKALHPGPMSNPGPWKIVSNSDETLMSSRSALPAPTTVPTSVEELERLQAQLKNSRRYKEHQDSAKRDALDLHITEVAGLLKVARQKANPAHAVAPAAAAWAATAGAAAAAAGRRKLAGSCCF